MDYKCQFFVSSFLTAIILFSILGPFYYTHGCKDFGSFHCDYKKTHDCYVINNTIKEKKCYADDDNGPYLCYELNIEYNYNKNNTCIINYGSYLSYNLAKNKYLKVMNDDKCEIYHHNNKCLIKNSKLLKYNTIGIIFIVILIPILLLLIIIITCIYAYKDIQIQNQNQNQYLELNNINVIENNIDTKENNIDIIENTQKNNIDVIENNKCSECNIKISNFVKMYNNTNTLKCPICLDYKDDLNIIIPCGHTICLQCRNKLYVNFI